MAKRLVEYELKSGESVVIEVDEPQGAGPREAWAKPWEPQKITDQKFEDALEKIKPTTEAVMNSLKGLGPKTVQMEFGIKISGAVGAIIASAGVEANYKITLTWEG